MGGAEGHTPVLMRLVRERLAPRPDDVVLDATVGLGGHARMLGEQLGPLGRLIGLDVDPVNLEAARGRLQGLPARVDLIRENFCRIEEVLRTLGLAGVDVILADLGVSSPQLEDSQRGFSFQVDGPLDMRMDDRLTDTAADLINRLPESDLSDLIFFNSQERFSRRIARRICQIRRDGRITTTGQLVDAVASALGVDPLSRKSKIHPATLTFQALRIAVNDELEALKVFLERAPNVLNPRGRLGVISFHSLEDGQVKRDLLRRREEGLYRILTKKPDVADEDERRENRRSRSAKLRVAVRLEAGAVKSDQDFTGN